MIRIATEPIPPGWELNRRYIGFDCFGVHRRAWQEYSKDVNRWEDDGGR